MTRPELLNREAHGNLRVITGRGERFGENIHFVPVLAGELRALVVEYPVFLMKDENTGQFGLGAVLGLEPGENLFLRGDIWRAAYLPMNIRRQPFLVARRDDQSEGEGSLALDMDSPRVQSEQGEVLFDTDGNVTPFLEEMKQLMAGFMVASDLTTACIQALLSADLVAPARLEVRLKGGEPRRYDGLYSVDEEKLATLDADTLLDFHQKGYLQACYLLLASTANVQKLVAMKESALGSAGEGTG